MTTEQERRPGREWQAWVLIAVLASAFWLVIQNLGHPTITSFDEMYHALVAKNFLKHPLTPTLVDRPYVAADHRDWTQNHIWLHKPPLAMWQIAASQALLGVTNWSLRLPSALLHMGACAITFLIGRALFSRSVGLAAAAWQAFNPFLASLVHGYQFCDHVDIALLFWMELSIYLLACAVRRPHAWLYAATGAAAGAAFLAKSFPALLVPGMAMGLALLRRWGPWRGSWPEMSGRYLGLLAAAFACVALPWNAWCLLRHRPEFLYEMSVLLGHLNVNVEGWQGPWDKHLFGYLPRMGGGFYLALCVGASMAAFGAMRRRNLGDVMLALWVAGVIVPFSLARSKPVPMLAPALPALALAAAAAGWRVWNAGGLRLASTWACLWFALWLVPLRPEPAAREVATGLVPEAGRAIAAAVGRWAPSLARQPVLPAQWVMWASLAALALPLAELLRRRLPADRAHWATRPLALACLVPLTPLTVDYVRSTVAVTQKEQRGAAWEAFGIRVRESVPPNSVLFWEDCRGNEYLDLMYHSDRTVYSLKPSHGSHPAEARRENPHQRPLEELVAEATRNGAEAYLVTSRPRPGSTVVETLSPRRCRVVRLPPPER